MNKIVIFLLTGVLSLGVLAGCGEDEQLEAKADISKITSGSDESVGTLLMNGVVKDLELNDVELSDYIKENKVTMINVWGTFCGPCIREMPDLGEIERKYKDQGFEIVGLTSDVCDNNGNYDEDVIDDAISIINDTKITYPVLVSPVELMENLKIQYVPTTFFLDSDGKLLGDPEIGSKTSDEWEEIIYSYLSQED